MLQNMDRRAIVGLIAAFLVIGAASLGISLLDDRNSCEQICARKNQKSIFLGVASLKIGGGSPICRCIPQNEDNKTNPQPHRPLPLGVG